VVLNCLTTYSNWSGKHINIAKSAMFFSKNCRTASRNSINGILNLIQVPTRAKYLGIPLFLHKRKSQSFIDLKDRIFSKITSWKAQFLSQAAGTTVIKTIANAIPTYIMSIFLLPKSLCTAINTTLRKFWWGFPQDKKHNLSLLSCESICQPKALGGLGLRSMKFLNHSLLARLGWKMTSNQPLLWVDVLRGKYLKNGVSFLNTSSNPSASWLWKGLLKNRKVVQKGACISISCGLNVDI
jgi:hypothetical protein